MTTASMRDRLAVHVLHANLALAIRPEVRQFARAADFAEPLRQFMRQQ